ncbi:MAG: 5-formyltetrahydrofolate cyclo-ligase [Treponema sp.]|nr:5-formyltetrahydrofolate cyclo-ligase [Treponema sp.]MBR2107575.1 5-formyltetrahydrofolate cyclo-ligase [Treponema sp.]
MQNITKQELRQKIKIELSQNKQNFEKWSKLICQNIINSEFYQKAQIVYAYMALPDEVDLSVLIDDALCKNKTVFVPKVVPNSNKMIFFDYSKCQFENGSFGILEPKTEDIKEEKIAGDQTAIFLVPGRVFGEDGERIGRGKGFYDIYLSNFLKTQKKSVLVAGVCFPIQIGKQVPTTEHDIKMDQIFTCPK